MGLALTRHAERRLQGRAIRPEVIDLLLDFGTSSLGHHGAEIVFFDKASRDRLRRAEPASYRRYERGLNAYAVVSDNGALITAGWRRRGLRAH